MRNPLEFFGARFLAALVVLAFPRQAVYSQTSMVGSLRSYVDDFIASMPTANGGGSYQPPDDSALTMWRSAYQEMAEGNAHRADSLAELAGYRVVLFTDTSSASTRLFYLLEKDPSSANHWGLFLVNPSPQRPDVVLQSPHPRFDTNTGYQGIYLFLETGARAFSVAGTHRCSNSNPTPCSGTTTACTGGDAPYPLSDQAHVVAGTLQASTEVMASLAPGAVFIQLHGFARGSGDPDAIVSNGTRKTPSADYVVMLRDRLLEQDATLTFRIIHIDLTWTKLTAFTNTQGRLLNSSPNPCTVSATNTTGRFVHIEQAFTTLRQSELEWQKMAWAIENAFMPVSAVGDGGSDEIVARAELRQNYPNPFNPATSIEIVMHRNDQVLLEVFDISGKLVDVLLDGYLPAGTHIVRWDAASVSSGTYVYRLSSAGRVVARKLMVLR